MLYAFILKEENSEYGGYLAFVRRQAGMHEQNMENQVEIVCELQIYYSTRILSYKPEGKKWKIVCRYVLY